MGADLDQRIADWLDDRLDSVAMKNFEARLREDEGALERLVAALNDEAVLARAVETHAVMSESLRDRTPDRSAGQSADRKGRMWPLMMRGVAIAAMAVVAFGLVWLQRPVPAAAVTRVNGSAEHWHRDGSRSPVASGSRLLSGDRLVTGSGTVAVLTLADGSELTLMEETMIGVVERERSVELTVKGAGRLLVAAVKQAPGETLRVLTDHAIASVVGTHFEVQTQLESSRVLVNEGQVLVQNRRSGRAYRVSAGETVLVTKNEIGIPASGDSEREIAEDGLLPGLNAYHVVGNYRNSQELPFREAVVVSAMDEIGVPSSFREVAGGVVLKGFLAVPTAGVYELEAMADDGVDVEIDGELVLRSAQAKQWVRGRVELAAGLRLLRIGYLNTQSAGALELRWGKAGEVMTPVAASLLRRRPARKLRSGGGDHWVATIKAYQDFAVAGLGDDDPQTHFWGDRGLLAGDQVAVYLGTPRSVSEIVVKTGSEQAPEDFLRDGGLEVSQDGTTFVRIADFAGGIARGEWRGGDLRAVRIVADAPTTNWLAVSEFTLMP